MYDSILGKVIIAIKEVGRYQPETEQRSEFYNSLFNPEAYLEQQERRRRKEELVSKLIVGATALAATGEIYHVLKRSDTVKTLLKKIK